ncbi:hypothetical protein MKW94_014552 [Papaver nudicaule]|uniref:RING-type domain-containing protein n=1 Tax=Papaver nudicaule TaxID=74823 RepID=A0AA41VNV9_PAPNU|nr:hypothetical protein [Papaver nudicaule]
MGNKICSSRRNMVEERFTRPQRLIGQPSYVDYKKLRKLILNEKLAPCFDGIEDISDDNSNSDDLEECPICFFLYPSLNRSRCCMKGICTECFLQMKPSPLTQLTQCPFCKCSSYTVEYRGARTKEEKCIEQAQEQKVMEAKIRMRSEELQSSGQVRLANRNLSDMEVQSPASGSLEASNSGVQDLGAFNLPSAGGHVDASESSVLNAWNERNAEFGVDLEELMMMEAIWRSIQDTASHKCAPEQSSGSNGIGRSQIENHLPYEIISSSTLIDPPDCLPSDSVSGGIAIAVARIAERNILQSGTFHSIREISQTSQIQDEISMGEHEAGPFESPEDADVNDARSGDECLSISSTSGDDSWDSFSASFQDSDQHSDGDGFNSDEEDPVDSCGSSVHTISDVSTNQGPSDFNNYESFRGSNRPGPTGSQAEFRSLDNSNS